MAKHNKNGSKKIIGKKKPAKKGLTAAQKKLPLALQKAILAKQNKK